MADTVLDDRRQSLKWSGAQDTSARPVVRFAANGNPRSRKWERAGGTTCICLLASTDRAWVYGRPLLRRLAGREWRMTGLVSVVNVQRRCLFSCSVKMLIGE